MNIPEKIRKHEPFWGSWYIDALIGEGGFGNVYKIKRREFGETHYCALKHIQIPKNENEIRQMEADGSDEDTISSYFKSVVEDIYSEIRLMSKLKGTSNIVSYEDHQIIAKDGEIGYDIFIRMEYLTELNKYIATNGITRGDIIKLGIDLCAGLELCQKYNIIHRDIKPENIYVSPSGDYKLGDFGISKQAERTMSGTRIGTPEYMAPEVYKGEKYNTTVDIYSVGLVMYRYLNGNRLPFMPAYPGKYTTGDKANALSSRLSGKAIPAPQGAPKGRLGEIVVKACSYDKRDRYSSPMLMRMELEKIKYTKEEREVIYPSGDAIQIDLNRDTPPEPPKKEKYKKTEKIHETKQIEEKANPKQKMRLSTRVVGAVVSCVAVCVMAVALIVYVSGGKTEAKDNKDNIPGIGTDLKSETVAESYTSDDNVPKASENITEQAIESTEPTISSTPEPTETETTTIAVAETTAAITTEPPKATTQEQTTVEPTTGLSGDHTQTYANGDKYSGNFVNGVRSGQGTYTWASGLVYIGEFVNGDPSGKGEYIYPTTEPVPTTLPPQTPTTAAPTTAVPPTTQAPTAVPSATVPSTTQPPATTAPTTEPAIYDISINPSSDYEFPEAKVGYGEQKAYNITINNIGNRSTGEITITLAGTSSDCFILSKTSIDDITVNGSDSFTIVPKTGLPVGTYSAVIKISGIGNQSTIAAEFREGSGDETEDMKRAAQNFTIDFREQSFTSTDNIFVPLSSSKIVIREETFSVENYADAWKTIKISFTVTET